VSDDAAIPFKKGGKPGPGRPKGLPNKTTRTALETIAMAAEGIGGGERLIEWAKGSPENERVFWGTIYPKLLPLQVTGRDGGAIETNSKVSVDLRPKLTREEWLSAHGMEPPARPAD